MNSPRSDGSPPSGPGQMSFYGPKLTLGLLLGIHDEQACNRGRSTGPAISGGHRAGDPSERYPRPGAGRPAAVVPDAKKERVGPRLTLPPVRRVLQRLLLPIFDLNCPHRQALAH
jgi:hypothetical protein